VKTHTTSPPATASQQRWQTERSPQCQATYREIWLSATAILFL